MEAIVDPHGRIVDMWPQTLAMPGFLSGLIFSGVLSMTEGRWRFEDLSLPRVGAWGAVAGALIILVGVLIGLQPGGPVQYIQTWTRIMRRRRISPEHSQLRGCHEPETAIRKQTSLIEHGAVNLVTKHPQDSRHPRHGVQEALPTQR
jgi:hypothetical protein